MFVFYEVAEPGLTNDYLAYHDNAMESTYQLYQEKKSGILSTFPFGTPPFTPTVHPSPFNLHPH